MTIKDFKVGQTAYIVGDGQRRDDDKTVAVKVVKVGRRYVTVNEGGRQETRFYEPITPTSYLVEDKEYGAKRLLFPTSEAAGEYNELNDMRSWVQEATDWMKLKDYTLAQLRVVKKILEGDDRV